MIFRSRSTLLIFLTASTFFLRQPKLTQRPTSASETESLPTSVALTIKSPREVSVMKKQGAKQEYSSFESDLYFASNECKNYWDEISALDLNRYATKLSGLSMSNGDLKSVVEQVHTLERVGGCETFSTDLPVQEAYLRLRKSCQSASSEQNNELERSLAMLDCANQLMQFRATTTDWLTSGTSLELISDPTILKNKLMTALMEKKSGASSDRITAIAKRLLVVEPTNVEAERYARSKEERPEESDGETTAFAKESMQGFSLVINDD